MSDLFWWIGSMVAVIFKSLIFIILFAFIYFWLVDTFRSIAKQEKVSVLRYYGVVVPLVYLLYLPMLKIGGVDNLNARDVIIKTYLVILGFVSIPRFFIFSERTEREKEAETFGLVLATAIFMALSVYMVGHTLDIPSFMSTNISPNKGTYLFMGGMGIIVGIVIENSGKSVLGYIKSGLEVLSKIKKKVTS